MIHVSLLYLIIAGNKRGGVFFELHHIIHKGALEVVLHGEEPGDQLGNLLVEVVPEVADSVNSLNLILVDSYTVLL